MKKFNVKDLNTPKYWDSHQTAFDFGLRQEEYMKLSGVGERIIELGCGLSPFISKARFKDKWGLDFSPETIRTASQKFPDVKYIESSAIDTPFKDKFFDVSVAAELIEHLQDPSALIREMCRITKKKIIISTPHLEFNDPEHLWEFSEQDLEDLFIGRGKTQVYSIESERFPGRVYRFAVCNLYEVPNI